MNESKEKKLKRDVNILSTILLITEIIFFVIEVTNFPFGSIFTNFVHPGILLSINFYLIYIIASSHDKSIDQKKLSFKRCKESIRYFKTIDFDKLIEMMLINVITGFLVLQKDKVKTLTGYCPIFWGILILIFVVLNGYALYIIKKSKLRKNRPEYYHNYGLALFYIFVNSGLLLLFMLIPHMLWIMFVIDVVYIVVFVVVACKNLSNKKNF